jgi:hypothetical protein
MSSAALALVRATSIGPATWTASPVAQRFVAHRDPAVDDVEVPGAACAELMVQSSVLVETRDQDPCILGEVEPGGARRSHDLEPPVGPFLKRVLSLLYAGLEVLS